MSDLFWLSDEQMARLRPYFPKSHGRPRVDDRRVLSGIIFINRNGLRWRDAPRDYGPPKALYNRWKRWSDLGVFARIMEGLAAEAAEPKTVMIDATYLKAHRTATRLRSSSEDQETVRGLFSRRTGSGRLIGRTKSGMNTKLHAVSDAEGRPIRLFMTAGPVSDYTGAAAQGGLPPGSLVSATGLPPSPMIEAARARGVLDAEPMFSEITQDGVRWADGREVRADAILWATGFGNALAHLDPLGLKNDEGGIVMTGRLATQVAADPRIPLVGYGPSASTIGANRAGRAAAEELMRFSYSIGARLRDAERLAKASLIVDSCAAQGRRIVVAKALNKKNLLVLGPERLADLLLEVTKGRADMQRRLRLELSAQVGAEDVARDIRSLRHEASMTCSALG